MADEEDVPPLEDMSEFLLQVEALREHKQAGLPSTSSGVPDRSWQTMGRDWTLTTRKEKEVSDMAAASSTKSPAMAAASSTKSEQSTFGGMKKGFLFGSSSPPKQKPKQKSANSDLGVSSALKQKAVNSDLNLVTKKLEEMPFIKPREPDARDTQYRMPEVQEAMKASQSLLDNKDWVSDDLLERVQKNPILMKYLADPKFSQALAEFQSNPQGAQIKYADNPEIQLFFKEFCGLLGDHFTKIADTEDSIPSSTSQGSNNIKLSSAPRADIKVHDPNAPTAAEQQRMQEILSRPDVREALMDPKIQNLMEQLRTSPSEAQRLLQTKDPLLHQKISILVSAGLLQFQS